MARWYALRHEQPQERRHPDRVITVDRIDYYGQQAVEAFWAAHQEGVGTGRLGVSGRRSGAEGGGRGAGRPVSQKRAQAVEIALAELHRAGSYQRGLAARLARTHGGGASTWERAVNTARTAYDEETEREARPPSPEQDRPRPVVPHPLGPAPRVGPKGSSQRSAAASPRPPPPTTTPHHHSRADRENKGKSEYSPDANRGLACGCARAADFRVSPLSSLLLSGMLSPLLSPSYGRPFPVHRRVTVRAMQGTRTAAPARTRVSGSVSAGCS